MKSSYLYCLLFIFFGIILNAQSPEDPSSTNDPELNSDNVSFDTPVAIVSKTTESVLKKVDVDNGNNIDLTRLMQSKLAGLNIFANSFTPGASSRMTFRGYRSISNSNEPLLLLNGVPISNVELLNGFAGTDQSNRLIDLDPHFIENIEFIGSASGRARYGIVGANGIISIQTKSDNSKKLKIGFSSSIMNGNVSQLPQLQNTRGQGRIIAGTAQYLGPETSNGFSWGPLVSDLYYDNSKTNLYDNNGVITTDLTANPAGTYDPYLFFNDSWAQNYSLSLSKSTSIFSTSFVGSYSNETGVIPTNQFSRYSLGVNIGIRPLKNLRLNVNGAISGSNAMRSIKGSSINGIMLGLLRTSPTFDNANGLKDAVSNQASYLLPDGNQRSYRGGIYDNPYYSINENKNTDNVARRIFQLSGKYNFSEKWSLLFNSGIDNFDDFRKGRINNFNPQVTFFNGNAYQRSFDYTSSHIAVSSVYNFLSSDRLNLDFTLGYEYNQSSLTRDFREGSVRIVNGIVELENAETIDVFNAYSDFKRSGGIFAIDFAFGQLLDLDASVRHDYSNRFGSSTNGFTSWGIGGSFHVIQLRDSISKPYFNVALISSIGRSGNTEGYGNNIGAYVPAVVGGDPFISSFTINGYEPNNISRSDLLTAESNVAFDAGIRVDYRSWISSKITFYNEESSGLHLVQTISSTSGLNNQQLNLGSITNRGIDISMNVNPIQSRIFDWSFDIHFNKNYNVVNTLFGNSESSNFGPFLQTSSIAQEGHAYGVISGSGFMRNDAGEMIIGDDGWPLTDNDKLIVADPNPDWMLFFGNNLSLFKHLTLSTLIEIKQGGDLFCGTCGTLDYFGRTQRAVNEIDQSVVFEGVTETGEKNIQEVELAPSSGTYSSFYRVRYGFGGLSENNIYDASWIKLRNLSLTYDFSNLLKLKNNRSLSLGLTMENFILRTSYPGIDPETNLLGNSGGIGIDYYNNPGVERYGIHLKLNF